MLHTVTKRNKRQFFSMLLAALVLLTVAVAVQAASNTITTPDTGGDIGRYTSLDFDKNGNPVVSYSDDTNGSLKVMHCNDPNCAGNDESITSPDSAGVGRSTSLQLDLDGNPVISYYSKGHLKVMHCNDPNCAGNNESIATPDTAGNDTRYTSLALDIGGYPVVSYYGNSGDLKVLHCNDVDCKGDDESISSPDTAGDVGQWSSLVLDRNGYPVVSYFDATKRDLKVLHCNDPDCKDDDESITSPDTDGTVGGATSLALDSSGFPVVSYIDFDNPGNLIVMHCNDANCAGNNESIILITTTGGAAYPSLVLDPSGNPVISYYGNAVTNGALKVLRCNDPNCDATVNGAESNVSIVVGGIGQFSSLALDSNGRPVASFYRVGGPLNLLHCASRNCDESSDDLDNDEDGIPDDYDTDDDNDGQRDEDEIVCGTDPLDSSSKSPDTNNNGIPNCIDVDTDGDGLLDRWERMGLTVTVDGVTEFIDLPKMGADPQHKDIFVEIDYMVSITHTHKPPVAAIADVVTAFDEAPVDNPDGKTGVHLHVDFGADAPLTYGMTNTAGITTTWGALSKSDALTHLTKFGKAVGQSGYSWASFDGVKKSYFTLGRAAVFHYNLWVHDLSPEYGGTSGLSRDLGSSDFIVSLGQYGDALTLPWAQAGTFMHELGHNLGLHHGGQDEFNNKPNHLSVMNYSFQMTGLIIDNTQPHFDYSRFDLPSLNENDLNETVGIHLPVTTTRMYGTYSFCPDGKMVTFSDVATYVDWNCKNGNIDTGLKANINRGKSDTTFDILTAVNEWKILIYNGGALGQPGVRIELPDTTVVNEITKEEADQIPLFIPEGATNQLYLPLIMQ